MQLRQVPGGSSRWNEGVTFLRTYGYMPEDFRPNARRHSMWVLEDGTGGTFDEVTEEVTGRPMVAVMVTLREMYTSDQFALVVDPQYRRQGWARRMMTWLLANNNDVLYATVDVYDAASMAFAARYGVFEGGRALGMQLTANVRFSFQNTNWRHAGCRCQYCLEELSSLTSGNGRVVR